MEWIFFAWIVVGAVLFFVLRNPSKKESSEPEVRLPGDGVFPLGSEQGRKAVTVDGVRYRSYEGEFDPVCGIQVWDWHGRMGDGLGYLAREKALIPEGELYRLRDGGEVLLAFLPGDGWPITDMQLMLPEAFSFPELTPDAFCFGEWFRVEGEFEEEEWERMGEISEPSLVRALAYAWLQGEPVTLSESVEYTRYRVRLYSKDVPGLYVTFWLNVCEDTNCYAVEQYRFRGDALLPPTVWQALWN